MIAFKGQGDKVTKRSIFLGQNKVDHVISHSVDLHELIPNMYRTCMFGRKMGEFRALKADFLDKSVIGG